MFGLLVIYFDMLYCEECPSAGPPTPHHTLHQQSNTSHRPFRPYPVYRKISVPSARPSEQRHHASYDYLEPRYGIFRSVLLNLRIMNNEAEVSKSPHHHHHHHHHQKHTHTAPHPIRSPNTSVRTSGRACCSCCYCWRASFTIVSTSSQFVDVGFQ